MNQEMLQDGERIDDLLTKALKIIQSEEVFSFSLDAVLLARFCSVPPKGKIVDLCTGNGVIPLLLSTRTKAELIAVEIQEKLANMAMRNVQLNHLEKQIKVFHRDLRGVHEHTGCGGFDLVTVNPPYLPTQSGERSNNIHMAIAKHEIECTLEEVINESSKLVRSGGKVAMVHKPSRLIEIVTMLRKYGLEPKRIRFVHPRSTEEANMVLIESSRNGKPEVRLLPPLIVYGADGQYCDELLKIYYGREKQLRNG